ncbi:MAG: hypothetical protein QXI22_02940 [Sulfolobales archaeon]
MFLKPHEGLVKIYGSRKLFLIWWPFTIVNFNTCENNYLVDLLVASEITDPLPLILTMRRYRDKRPIEPSPSVEAPILIPRSVGPNTIMELIYKIKKGIEMTKDKDTSQSSRPVRSYRYQMFSKRPSTLEEAIANPVSRGILSEILSSICISSNNVRITSYNPIHVLVGISKDMKEFSLFMDKKIRSINHEIYVLTNEHVKDLIEKYMKLNI